MLLFLTQIFKKASLFSLKLHTAQKHLNFPKKSANKGKTSKNLNADLPFLNLNINDL